MSFTKIYHCGKISIILTVCIPLILCKSTFVTNTTPATIHGSTQEIYISGKEFTTNLEKIVDIMHGEAMANATIFPKNRVHQVPLVIITPKEQTIRQPAANVVLQGSTNIDEENIVSWHWKVVSGPSDYQPTLPEVSTLQLTDLTSPGNYGFKLTVTNTDNVTNFNTATVTVLKGTDYPPVANAGNAVILYLPNNSVILNGTSSSDDHEIVAWKWTQDDSDKVKALDMQNTRTPCLLLSNLEEGIYTFLLQVTDGSGQYSTAKVRVFVKSPTMTLPKAESRSNMLTKLFEIFSKFLLVNLFAL